MENEKPDILVKIYNLILDTDVINLIILLFFIIFFSAFFFTTKSMQPIKDSTLNEIYIQKIYSDPEVSAFVRSSNNHWEVRNNYPKFDRLVYAIDVAIPLLNLGQANSWEPIDQDSTKYFFIFYRTSTFFIISLIISKLFKFSLGGSISIANKSAYSFCIFFLIFYMISIFIFCLLGSTSFNNTYQKMFLIMFQIIFIFIIQQTVACYDKYDLHALKTFIISVKKILFIIHIIFPILFLFDFLFEKIITIISRFRLTNFNDFFIRLEDEHYFFRGLFFAWCIYLLLAFLCKIRFFLFLEESLFFPFLGSIAILFIFVKKFTHISSSKYYYLFIWFILIIYLSLTTVQSERISHTYVIKSVQPKVRSDFVINSIEANDVLSNFKTPFDFLISTNLNQEDYFSFSLINNLNGELNCYIPPYLFIRNRYINEIQANKFNTDYNIYYPYWYSHRFKISGSFGKNIMILDLEGDNKIQNNPLIQNDLQIIINNCYKPFENVDELLKKNPKLYEHDLSYD